MKEISIKFINEIDVDFSQEFEDEEVGTLTIYECNGCNWRFIGDCNRYDCGYTSEYTQTPNFCPMCGSKIK